MNTQASQYGETFVRAGAGTPLMPSKLVEYSFYFYICYTLLGGALGLWVNNLASGLLVLLVIFCLSEVGSQAINVIRVLAFPLGCGVAYTFVQLVVFEESINEAVRPFLIWMLVLFIVQLIALRPNFIHRFILVMVGIGIAALPYLSFHQAGTMQRASLDSAVGFGQTNEMGAWYGFCALYFVVRGITAKTLASRNLSWLVALGSLYLVTLTVSRGALLAFAVAVVVAARHMLKRGFLPILGLACLVAIVIGLGIFDQTIQFYSARGAEDTGRLAVWPLIIDSFLNSPLTGVGHSHVGATPPGRIIPVTPHNGFLYIAQSSGIVPLVLFIFYWLRSGLAAFRADVGIFTDAEFCLPLVVYTFIAANLGAFAFMHDWAVVALAIPMTESLRREA